MNDSNKFIEQGIVYKWGGIRYIFFDSCMQVETGHDPSVQHRSSKMPFPTAQ